MQRPLELLRSLLEASLRDIAMTQPHHLWLISVIPTFGNGQLKLASENDKTNSPKLFAILGTALNWLKYLHNAHKTPLCPACKSFQPLRKRLKWVCTKFCTTRNHLVDRIHRTRTANRHGEPGQTNWEQLRAGSGSPNSISNETLPVDDKFAWCLHSN